MNAQLPRRSGGFELQRELGRGGMGVVYQAQELSSGRVVALKVLLAEHSVSEEAFERFQREARIAASISDSRCVFVYGAHQVDDAPAISMELVGGETLEHKLARGETIPIQTAVRWTLDVLDGLEAAAAAGVVHRDVKPSNCFVTADGQVKVGDFGLARTFEADLRLTLTGQFLGSPLYASPEQIKGRDVDARSDLYSCGATLYALLVGHAPHSGSNLGEVLSRILSESPAPLRTVRPEIPRALERVVLQAMERDPKKRFQTHADMRAALQPFISSGAQPANPLRRGIAYAVDWVALQFAVLAIVAVAGWLGANLDVEGSGDEGKSLALVGLLVPWLYFTLLEAFSGASLGKWLCGLRVIAQPTLDPRVWIALRAALFTFPEIAVGGALLLFPVKSNGVGFLLGVLPFVVMALYFVTARPWNGWRGVHEFASRTRVVQRRTAYASVARSAPPERTPLESYAGMPARVGRYSVKGSIGKTASGVLLEAHDDELQRSVWILETRADGAPLDETRRSRTRVGRLRWLDTTTSSDVRCDVFEAPGGASLLACARRRTSFTWLRSSRVLASLAAELESSEAEHVSLEQLWIDGSWNVRVLDEPLGGAAARKLAPEQLLVAVARTMLPERGVLPPDLPEHAEEIAHRLFGVGQPFATLAEARKALRVLDGRAANVARRTRAVQLALNSAPAIVLTLCLAIGFAWVLPRAIDVQYGHEMAERLVSGVVEVPGANSREPKTTRPLTDDERTAREILIGAANHASLGLEFNVNTSADKDEAVARYRAASEKYANPSDAEIAWAREHFGPGLPDTSESHESFGKALPSIPLGVLVFWGMLASSAAILLRGGLSFRVFDLRLRDRRGRLASRWMCFVRSLVVWVPLSVSYATALVIAIVYGSAIGLIALALVALLHAGGIAYALFDPARSIPDRICGTRIVPR